LPFSVSTVAELPKRGRGEMDKKTTNGKRKPKFFLTPIAFAHRANGSLSFVRLLTEKQTEVNRLLTE
jgi:hypothetical protein